MTITKKITRTAQWKIFSLFVRIITAIVMYLSKNNSVVDSSYIQLWSCFFLVFTASVSYYASNKTTFKTKLLLFITTMIELSVNFMNLVLNLVLIEKFSRNVEQYTIRFELVFTINTFWTLIDFAVCIMLLCYCLQLRSQELLLSPQTRSRRNSRRGAITRTEAHSSHGNRDQDDFDQGNPKQTTGEDVPGNSVSLNTNCQINTEDDITPPPYYSEANSVDDMPSFPPPGYDVTTRNFES